MARSYEITAGLGHGGMSDVYAARRVSDGAMVALKMLRPESRFLHEATARLQREALAASKVQSPHVARVLDVINDAETGIVIAFEYLIGESLEARLHRCKRLSFAETHPIVTQVLLGLVSAHAVQVIHRDLKPGNVFLEQLVDGTERVKILDFGVSKLPSEHGFEVLTKKWQILGTFSYMPPEQIRTPSLVDSRADLYACGAVIFRMLIGELPHAARNLGDLIMTKRTQPARKLNGILPQAVTPFAAPIEQFVDRMLAMEPEARYQSAREALDAWQALASPPPTQGHR